MASQPFSESRPRLGWLGTFAAAAGTTALGGCCFIALRRTLQISAARRRLRALLDAAAGEDARIVITGATSGIGLELARQFARHPSVSLLLACRDTKKAERQFPRTDGRVSVTPLRLLDFDSVQAFTEEAHEFLAGGSDGLRLLVNNAGVMRPPPGIRPSALDPTWQTNFLAPFLATELLARRRAKDRTRRPLRVVQVSSRLEKRSELSEELLAAVARGEPGEKQYSDSKRALMLWIALRAQGLAFKGFAFAHCATPGMVDTELGRHSVSRAWLWHLSKPLRFLLLRPPAEGALGVAAAGLRPQATGTFGRYMDGEKELEDLVMERASEKQFAQKLVKWATEATALEARALGYDR